MCSGHWSYHISAAHERNRAGICPTINKVLGQSRIVQTEADRIEEQQGCDRRRRELAYVTEPRRAIGVPDKECLLISMSRQHGRHLQAGK